MFAELETAIIEFVVSLVTEDAARKLRFQPSGASLCGEILDLLSQLFSNNTMTEPLLAAVAANVSRENIWSALYDLITASTVIQQPTPSITHTPAAPTPVDEGSEHEDTDNDDTNNDDALIIHTSASQEGD